LTKDLLTAFALLLIIEGLLPFFVPDFWRKTMQNLSQLNPKTVRTGGIISLLAGAVLLQFT
jgi:uncharacterized protein YjeT (DUF2065 family)